MGRAPAYVFAVRHASRLDQANKQWHFSSPTPYDTPITYSGWAQAKAIGRRIGDVLRERQVQDDAIPAAAESDSSRRKRRRFEVVIHSSPFLRCIQTSVGISAGLAVEPSPARSALPTGSMSSSLVLDTADQTETADSSNATSTIQSQPSLHKCVLRLDSFLGEWLTPSYYETISSPPAAAFMLASAKAELLRREDYANYTHLRVFPQHGQAASDDTRLPAPQSANPNSSSSQRLELWGLENVSAMASVLPRSNSISTASDISLGDDSSQTSGYVAPMSLHVVGHGSEIPRGLVAHARDHCCHVDYQWDSSREPRIWGDAGQMPEEWPEMHKRFRKGMQNMIEWYSTADRPTKMVTKERRPSKMNGNGDMCKYLERNLQADDGGDTDADDIEVETVIIVVTHGAGCNAIVGALTQKPVLTDIALASITQADRRADKNGDVVLAPSSGSNRDNKQRHHHHHQQLPLNEYYDLKTIGSTAHLRRRSHRSSRSPSIAALARGRNTNALPSSPLNSTSGFDGSVSRSSSAAANLGSARRDSGASSSMPQRIGLNTNFGANGGGGGGMVVGGNGFSAAARASSGGGMGNEPRLWSPLRMRAESVSIDEEEDDDDYLPNFSAADRLGASRNSSVVNSPEYPSRDSATTIQSATSPVQVPLISQVDGAIPRSIPPPPPTSDTEAATTVAAAQVQESSSSSPGKDDDASKTENDDGRISAPSLRLGIGAGGLWGSPDFPSRDRVSELKTGSTASKRRWTVDQRM